MKIRRALPLLNCIWRCCHRYLCQVDGTPQHSKNGKLPISFRSLFSLPSTSTLLFLQMATASSIQLEELAFPTFPETNVERSEMMWQFRQHSNELRFSSGVGRWYTLQIEVLLCLASLDHSYWREVEKQDTNTRLCLYLEQLRQEIYEELNSLPASTGNSIDCTKWTPLSISLQRWACRHLENVGHSSTGRTLYLESGLHYSKSIVEHTSIGKVATYRSSQKY